MAASVGHALEHHTRNHGWHRPPHGSAAVVPTHCITCLPPNTFLGNTTLHAPMDWSTKRMQDRHGP
eukprot:11142951-Ditylum_brightwellii.AAC.1